VKGRCKVKKDTKLGLFLSLSVLIGFPVVFVVISLLTGQWDTFLIGFPASFAAGFMGVWIAIREIKRERKSD
jgi:flagellar biosynthesis protein FliR